MWSPVLDQRLLYARAGGLPVKGLEVKSTNAQASASNAQVPPWAAVRLPALELRPEGEA